MAGFTKLFNSILDSTIWQEPNATRILWITMLAMSDAKGEVQASIPGLARRAGISLPECEGGLETLLSPDTYSRTPDHEGRRIEEVSGGWRLLNHGHYRALLSADERREYNRKKQAEYRAKKSNPVIDVSMTVNHSEQNAHITEVRSQKSEAPKNKRERFFPPTPTEIAEYGKTVSTTFTDHDVFHDFYQSKGWKVGASPMKDWKCALRNWIRRNDTAGQGKKLTNAEQNGF